MKIVLQYVRGLYIIMVIAFYYLAKTMTEFENFHMCNNSFSALSVSFFYVPPLNKLKILKIP